MAYDPACAYPGCGGTGTYWDGRRVARCPSCGGDVGTVTRDLRPYQASQYHVSAAASDANARQFRNERDRIIRELRAEDPKKWTMSRLAEAVDCSKELIAYILKTEDRDAGAGDEVPVQVEGTSVHGGDDR